MLAKVLKNGGNLIVLDEPTNDLDLPSLRMLEEALADFDGSVIVRFPRPLFPRPDLRPDHRLRGQRRHRPAGKLFLLSGKTPGPRSRRADPGAGRRPGCRRPPQGRRTRPNQTPQAHLQNERRTRRHRNRHPRRRAGGGGARSALNDPDFQANRFAEIPALVAKLDAAKAEVARLYQRRRRNRPNMPRPPNRIAEGSGIAVW